MLRREEKAPVHRGRRRGPPLRRPCRGRDRRLQADRGDDRRRGRARPVAGNRGRLRPLDRCRRVRASHRQRPRNVQGKAQARLSASDRHRRSHRHPGRAPRRHGHDPGAIQRSHRARLRQGEHQHRTKDRVYAVGSRLHERASRRLRPAQTLQRPARRSLGAREASHPALRQRRKGLDVTALVFDCDGVLADTERYGHLPAFNQTFREFGLPVQWSAEEYGRRLKIGGGKERMASLITPEFVSATGFPTDPAEQAIEVAKWHKRKTQLYTEMVAAGKLTPRPGIRRIIVAAHDAGWKLGVASTSAEAVVHAILEYAIGAERAARFDVFLAGDCVPTKKPAPDIYLLALEKLSVDPAEVLVVEDSRNGLEAGHSAR